MAHRLEGQEHTSALAVEPVGAERTRQRAGGSKAADTPIPVASGAQQTASGAAAERKQEDWGWRHSASRCAISGVSLCLTSAQLSGMVNV